MLRLGLRVALLSLGSSLLFSCSSGGDAAPEAKGIPALGAGNHDLASVVVDVIGIPDDGLDGPRDLDFNPYTPDELWVVSRNDESVVRYSNAGKPDQTQEYRRDSFAEHFMEEVSAISFSHDTTFENGNTFGTCQESENTYNDRAMGNGFMGPTLWTSDWEIFGFKNPEAVEFVGGDLGSHIDMMHESPNCMGIAWETANVYWTVDGSARTISRYDFAEDHDVGYDDHSDGTVLRYEDVEYSRVPDVPSHILFDHATGLVFYNDTAGSRLMRFDPSTATQSEDLSRHSMDRGEFYAMEGGDLSVVADGDSAGLVHPSGLALRDGVLYVSDNYTSRIVAIDASDGHMIDYLDTGLPEGSLMGIRVDEKGHIWAVDNLGNQVLRYRGK